MGKDPSYGGGRDFILERGSAGRLPWVTSLDGRVNLNYRLSKDSVLTASVEAFNIFNSQRPVSVDENYTPASVSSILGARQGSIPTEFGGVCTSKDVKSCASGNGSLPRPRVDPGSNTGEAIRVGLPDRNGLLSSQATNLNWGRPTNYQPVRQFRFGLRATF